jgi:hypothetical protein
MGETGGGEGVSNVNGISSEVRDERRGEMMMFVGSGRESTCSEMGTSGVSGFVSSCGDTAGVSAKAGSNVTSGEEPVSSARVGGWYGDRDGTILPMETE